MFDSKQVNSSDEGSSLYTRVPFTDFGNADGVSCKECNGRRIVKDEEESSLVRMSRGKRLFRLVELIGIIERQLYKRSRKLNPNAENQCRVDGHEGAVRHRGVVSNEQMRAAVLCLVGGNSSMSERYKSMLTQAFKVYLMLLRAAELH